MTEPLSAGRSDKFETNSFTPFFGQVEDVNDPEHTNRVKVRCIGIHPRNKKPTSGNDDNCPTDNLAWAKCLMPVTHAQQSRIGGKHYLQPGCTVYGFFLDGDECQQPCILGSLGFTANSGPGGDRELIDFVGGKLPDDTSAYLKILNSPETMNTARRTVDETGQNGPNFNSKADIHGDSINNDSDSKCHGKAALESAASASAKETFTNPENAPGQKYNVTTGDEICIQ